MKEQQQQDQEYKDVEAQAEVSGYCNEENKLNFTNFLPKIKGYQSSKGFVKAHFETKLAWTPCKVWQK